MQTPEVRKTFFIGDFLRVSCPLHKEAINPMNCFICPFFVELKENRMRPKDIVCKYVSLEK